MNAVFLETSALLGIIFQEPGFEKLEKKIRSAEQLVASRLLKIETERVLLRLALEAKTHQEEISAFRYELERFLVFIHFFEMTREICELAGVVAPHLRLRSLDAIHLATYLHSKKLEPTLEMLTLDQRIRSALL